jgi:hypothetical protein
MSVYLGSNGLVELRRSSELAEKTSVILTLAFYTVVISWKFALRMERILIL